VKALWSYSPSFAFMPCPHDSPTWVSFPRVPLLFLSSTGFFSYDQRHHTGKFYPAPPRIWFPPESCFDKVALHALLCIFIVVLGLLCTAARAPPFPFSKYSFFSVNQNHNWQHGALDLVVLPSLCSRLPSPKANDSSLAEVLKPRTTRFHSSLACHRVNLPLSH